MTTPIERWLIDTNVWIFGLRRDENFPESARVLDEIGSFLVLVPLQVIKELHLNLIDDEILQTVTNLPAEIVTPAQALSRLRSTNAE